MKRTFRLVRGHRKYPPYIWRCRWLAEANVTSIRIKGVRGA